MATMGVKGLRNISIDYRLWNIAVCRLSVL